MNKTTVWIATQDAAGSESPDQGQSTPRPIKFMVGRSNTSGSLTVQLFAPAGTAKSSGGEPGRAGDDLPAEWPSTSP